MSRASFLVGADKRGARLGGGWEYCAASASGEDVTLQQQDELSWRSPSVDPELDEVQVFWDATRSGLLQRVRTEEAVKKSARMSFQRTAGKLSPPLASPSSSRKSDEDELLALMAPKQVSRFIVSPTNPHKLSWDMFVGAIIMYSVTTIPWRIAYAQVAAGGALYLDFAVDICFLIDMLLSMLTAYTEDDRLITDHKLVALRYLRTWFFPDLLSTVPFDRMIPLLISGVNGDKIRSLKLIRAVRLFRLLKLMRIMRLSRKMENIDLTQYINPATVRLFKMLGKILFVAHLISCGWFLINNCAITGTTDGWLMCGGGSLLSKYLAAFYWTITTLMSVGYGDISADTVATRVYVLFVEVVGATAFGFIIAMVTVIVETLDPTATAKSNKMDEIREYMAERELSLEMQNAVRHHFTQFYSHVSVFSEAPILRDLPHTLRYKVAYYSRTEAVQCLRVVDCLDVSAVTELVYRLKPMTAVCNDILLRQGDPVEECFFIIDGKVEGSCPGVIKNSLAVLASVHTNGNDFELNGALNHCPAQLTYRAAVACRLLWLNTEDIAYLVQLYPSAQKGIVERAHAQAVLLQAAIDSPTVKKQSRFVKKLAVTDWILLSGTVGNILTRGGSVSAIAAMEQLPAINIVTAPVVVGTATAPTAAAAGAAVAGTATLPMLSKQRGPRAGSMIHRDSNGVMAVFKGDQIMVRTLKLQYSTSSAAVKSRRKLPLWQRLKLRLQLLKRRRAQLRRSATVSGNSSPMMTTTTASSRRVVPVDSPTSQSVEMTSQHSSALKASTTTATVSALKQSSMRNRSASQRTVSVDNPTATAAAAVAVNGFDSNGVDSDAAAMKALWQQQHAHSTAGSNISSAIMSAANSSNRRKASSAYTVVAQTAASTPTSSPVRFNINSNSINNTNNTELAESPSKPLYRTELKRYASKAELNRGAVVEAVETASDLLKRWIVLPSLPNKVKWDLFVGVLITLSVAIIPFRIGFEVEAKGGWIALDGLIDVCFALDILLNFRTAYVTDNGVYVTVPAMIARQYARGWLTADVLSTVPFDRIMHAVAHTSTEALRTLKLVRVLRMVRLLRLLRLLKLAAYSVAVDHVPLLNTAFFKVFKLLLTLASLGHLLGCFWSLVGLTPHGAGDTSYYSVHGHLYSGQYVTWWSAIGLPVHDVKARYIAAIYWAFTTTTTTGFGDITPVNDGERLYATCTMVIGATVFGYIIGSVSALVRNPNGCQARETERLLAVENFLHERRIIPQLSSAVIKHVEYSMTQRSAFAEDKLLDLLPPAVRTAVILQGYRDIIPKIALFKGQERPFAAYIVRRMVPQFCAAGTVIIEPHEESEGIYFVLVGIAETIRKNTNASSRDLPSSASGGSFRTAAAASAASGGGRANSTAATSIHAYISAHRVYDAGKFFGYDDQLHLSSGSAEGVRAFTDCGTYLVRQSDILAIIEHLPMMALKLRCALSRAIFEQDATAHLSGKWQNVHEQKKTVRGFLDRMKTEKSLPITVTVPASSQQQQQQQQQKQHT
jgi:CRP-like cAMP-binding protein